MDKETRTRLHKELSENPLFKEIQDYLVNEAASADLIIMSAPKPDAGQGFFAMREQVIGSKAQTEAFIEFLDDLPKPTE